MACGTRQPARFIVPLAVAAIMQACAAPGARSTRLTDRDLIDAVHRMRASLAASDFLIKRDADSEPVAIVIDRVENLTSDVWTRAEQWMLVARLRAALPIQQLAKHKNVSLLITPQQHAMIRRAGFQGDLGPATPATHVMSATFRSTRPTARTGADDYYLEYQITDRRTRQVVWTDSFEIKREAMGARID